jgi:hypothetical protein
MAARTVDPESPGLRQGDEPMPLLTVEGIYKEGKIELTERPSQVEEAARVLVTFLPSIAPVEKSAVDESQDRETLRQQAFAQMEKGFHLGGPPYPKREELYDRFDR